MSYEKIISCSSLKGGTEDFLSHRVLPILGISWIEYSIRQKSRTSNINELVLVHVDNLLQGGVF